MNETSPRLISLLVIVARFVDSRARPAGRHVWHTTQIYFDSAQATTHQGCRWLSRGCAAMHAGMTLPVVQCSGSADAIDSRQWVMANSGELIVCGEFFHDNWHGRCFIDLQQRMLDVTGLALRGIPVLTTCGKENLWAGLEEIIVRLARSIPQLASLTTLTGCSLAGGKVQVGIVSAPRMGGSSDSVTSHSRTSCF